MLPISRTLHEIEEKVRDLIDFGSGLKLNSQDKHLLKCTVPC
jgi:hypothetical protein